MLNDDARFYCRKFEATESVIEHCEYRGLEQCDHCKWVTACHNEGKDAPLQQKRVLPEDEPGRLVQAPHWHWRNCRSIGFSLSIWPLDWGLGREASGDLYGMEWRLSFGPLLFQLHANIGNPDNLFGGLCEIEAYERAVRYEART